MVRTRRESHHHDGITDPKDLQLPFATKSAKSRHRQAAGAFAKAVVRSVELIVQPDAHWVKVKNPKAPAVKREAEADWGRT